MQPQGTPGYTSPFSYQHFQLHFSGVCYAQLNTGPWALGGIIQVEGATRGEPLFDSDMKAVSYGAASLTSKLN